jgi:hypothetical protein
VRNPPGKEQSTYRHQCHMVGAAHLQKGEKQDNDWRMLSEIAVAAARADNPLIRIIPKRNFRPHPVSYSIDRGDEQHDGANGGNEGGYR